MNDKIDIILDIANKANQELEEGNLIIPILDGFEIVAQSKENENNFFVAKNQNTLEQFFNDGILKDDETFEDHIKVVNNSIEDTIANNELYKNKKCMLYFKAYQKENIPFKIYLQDILLGTMDKLNFVRQITAYFINDKTNEFCQLSIASGPYAVNERFKLLENVQDLDNDEIIKTLDKALTVVMDNIHYE